MCVIRSQKHPRNLIFDATVEKLVDEDVVLWFWLFLDGVIAGKDRGAPERLWKSARQRISLRPLETTVALLGRRPYKTLFDCLDPAMRALAGKHKWERAWKEKNAELYKCLQGGSFWTGSDLQEKAHRADLVFKKGNQIYTGDFGRKGCAD